jgi:iron complex transport system permease protein
VLTDVTVIARMGGLALVALTTCCASLLAGGTEIPPSMVWSALVHPHAPGDVTTIVWQLRMPRVVIAATVGGALGGSGALLQGMLRNPLVDPYLTGVSGGAAAAIAIAILAGIAAPALPGIGFVCGLLSAVLVAALARRGSGVDANRLILAGISLTALFSAIVAVALSRANSIDAATQILAWLGGSISGRGWHDLVVTLPYLFTGALLAVASIPSLNVLRVGELRARAVGVDVDRAQWLILGASALLAAASVTLAGIVGFVGLIVPNAARRIVGSDARVMLLACIFAGAALCTLADAVARTIVAPSELPIGVLLAFIGVPTFLYLYLRRDRPA